MLYFVNSWFPNSYISTKIALLSKYLSFFLWVFTMWKSSTIFCMLASFWHTGYLSPVAGCIACSYNDALASAFLSRPWFIYIIDGWGGLLLPIWRAVTWQEKGWTRMSACLHPLLIGSVNWTIANFTNQGRSFYPLRLTSFSNVEWAFLRSVETRSMPAIFTKRDHAMRKSPENAQTGIKMVLYILASVWPDRFGFPLIRAANVA